MWCWEDGVVKFKPTHDMGHFLCLSCIVWAYLLLGHLCVGAMHQLLPCLSCTTELFAFWPGAFLRISLAEARSAIPPQGHTGSGSEQKAGDGAVIGVGSVPFLLHFSGRHWGSFYRATQSIPGAWSCRCLYKWLDQERVLGLAPPPFLLQSAYFCTPVP